jgi:hypothetical protein
MRRGASLRLTLVDYVLPHFLHLFRHPAYQTTPHSFRSIFEELRACKPVGQHVKNHGFNSAFRVTGFLSLGFLSSEFIQQESSVDLTPPSILFHRPG